MILADQVGLPRLAEIFTCVRCGFCCQGETTVSLDQEDQERMATALGLTRQELEEQCWRVTEGVVQMRIVDHHCIFYRPDSSCAVHAGRPWRCGHWPLHPSILSDESNFRIIRESCPGIRKELSWEQFCAVLRRLLAQEDRLLC